MVHPIIMGVTGAPSVLTLMGTKWLNKPTRGGTISNLVVPVSVIGKSPLLI